MKSDAELLLLADELNRRLGRPPKTQELIDAAGGCQRQRALRTVQTLRVKLAEKAVRTQLQVPPAIREELDAVMARWLDCAAGQLAKKHAQQDLETETRLLMATDSAAEYETQAANLHARIADLEHLQRELLGRADGLQKELEVTRRERDRADALAGERQRVLDSWLTSSKEQPESTASQVPNDS